MSLVPRDLSLFTRGSAAERKEVADALCRDLSRSGFVKLVNHGLTDKMVGELFDWNKRFFRTPLEVKQRMAHEPGPSPQRGWSRLGAESSSKLYGKQFGQKDEQERSDAREHFDMGPVNDPNFPNKWPEEEALPGYRAFMESSFTEFQKISTAILKALEVALEIPEGSFAGKVSNSASELRFNRYPAINIEEVRKGSVSRIWPHFDLGVITLLFQDQIGGLEMEDRSKPGSAFIPIEATGQSEMIVNISETLQRWTNNCIRAGLHQVTLPPPLKGFSQGVIPERYSVAFFCKADREASVGPLTSFISAKTPAAYDDMTAIEYQQQRLLAAY